MKRKTLILAALGIFVFGSTALAEQDNRAMIKGIRAMGMGGAFTAIADDENAFFYNPAGIAQRQTYLLQVFNLDAAVNKTFFDFADFYSDNKDDLENFSDLSTDEQAKLLDKINNEVMGSVPNAIIGAPNFAYISKPVKFLGNYVSFGAGLFSYANAYFQFNHDVFVPSIDYRTEATAIAAVPVSYSIESLEAIKLPGKLSIGVNLKYIYRGKAEDDQMSVAEFEDYKVPMQTGGGYGMDFGLIYHPNPRWNVGMQLSDAFYTNIEYGNFKDSDKPQYSRSAYTAGIRPELNFGAAYFPNRIYYWPGRFINTYKRLTIAADLLDVANGEETITDSFWKKVHVGAELKYRVLSFRAGFNSGYPAAGVNVNIVDTVQLGYAFYGEEDGRYAGQDPSWFHRINIAVKIGYNKGIPFGKSVYGEKDIKEIVKPIKPQEEKKDIKPEDLEVQPAQIPKDAKDIISNPAKITEVK